MCVCVFVGVSASYFYPQGISDFGAKHWGSDRFHDGRFANLSPELWTQVLDTLMLTRFMAYGNIELYHIIPILSILVEVKNQIRTMGAPDFRSSQCILPI